MEGKDGPSVYVGTRGKEREISARMVMWGDWLVDMLAHSGRARDGCVGGGWWMCWHSGRARDGCVDGWWMCLVQWEGEGGVCWWLVDVLGTVGG